MAELTADQIKSARRQNDARFASMTEADVYRLHDETLAGTKHPDEYVAGVRRHLDSGFYSRIYPRHVVKASRRWLTDVRRR